MDFYPSLKKFLTEKDRSLISKYFAERIKESSVAADPKKPAFNPPAIRISDMKKVQAPDGEWIDMDELNFEMESAKLGIVTQSPLFGPFVHDMRPIYTWIIDTMATDGIRLFVNPQFAKNLSWIGKIFVILHEILHCVLAHMDRLGGRDHSKANIAADYEVNALLVDTFPLFTESFVKDDIHGLFDGKFTNWGFEEIYNYLEQNGWPKPPPPPKNPPPPPPASGKPTIKVGDKVRVHPTGQKAIVTKINSDGTFEVDPIINECFIALLEGYTRDQISPIKSAGEAGNPPPSGPSNPDDDTEIEEEGDGKGEGNDTQDPKGTKPKDKTQGATKGKGGKAIDQEGNEVDGVGGEPSKSMVDVGNAGKIITREQGKSMAQASGYDGNDLDDEYVSEKWEEIAKKIAEMGSGKKDSGRPGTERGESLVKRIKEIYKSAIDWPRLLKKYIGSALSPEILNTWAKKKHLYRDIYIRREKQKQDALSRIFIAVDTSGSMGEKTLIEVMREINGILKSKRAPAVDIIYFDTAVHHVETLTGAALKKDYKKLVNSGMGTDQNCVFQYIKDNYNNRAALLIFLTDDDVRHVGIKKPPYFSKIIWILYNTKNKTWMPYGKTLFIDHEE